MSILWVFHANHRPTAGRGAGLQPIAGEAAITGQNHRLADPRPDCVDGDQRLTVMAALTVADELAETGRRIRRREEEIAALQDARVVAAERSQQSQATVVAALNLAAERIEDITRQINQSVQANPGVAIG